MKLDEAIKGRRSIRKYKGKDIPNAVVEELLELAKHAPSSMDGQPWHFIVVRHSEAKKQLARIKDKYCPIKKKDYTADFLQGAAAVIVVCTDRKYAFERGVESAVLATANIMLAAHSRGLGSVYMSAYKDDEPAVSAEIRQVLNIPDSIDPVTIIPLGYPDEAASVKQVKPLKNIISYENFGKR